MIMMIMMIVIMIRAVALVLVITCQCEVLGREGLPKNNINDDITKIRLIIIKNNINYNDININITCPTSSEPDP